MREFVLIPMVLFCFRDFRAPFSGPGPVKLSGIAERISDYEKITIFHVSILAFLFWSEWFLAQLMTRWPEARKEISVTRLPKIIPRFQENIPSKLKYKNWVFIEFYKFFVKFASEVTKPGHDCSRLTRGVFKVEEGLEKSKKLFDLKIKFFEPFFGNMSF